MLIGGAEQIARHRGKRLRPREARAARQRDHVSQRIDRVQRPIGSERGFRHRNGDRIHSTAAQVQREQLMLGRGHEQVFRLGVETDHALDRGQLPLEDAIDGRQPGKSIEPGRAALGWQPDGHTGRAGEDLYLANLLG